MSLRASRPPLQSVQARSRSRSRAQIARRRCQTARRQAQAAIRGRRRQQTLAPLQRARRRAAAIDARDPHFRSLHFSILGLRRCGGHVKRKAKRTPPLPQAPPAATPRAFSSRQRHRPQLQSRGSEQNAKFKSEKAHHRRSSLLQTPQRQF